MVRGEVSRWQVVRWKVVGWQVISWKGEQVAGFPKVDCGTQGGANHGDGAGQLRGAVRQDAGGHHQVLHCTTPHLTAPHRTLPHLTAPHHTS